MKVTTYKIGVKSNEEERLLTITGMNTKLEGILAINTNPRTNNFCQAMRKDPNNICSKCYSVNSCKRYTAAEKCWQENSEILSQGLLEDQDLPKFRGRDIVRLSAHGELINKIHLLNYDKIIEANPDTQFALWTKRPELFKGLTKRPNCIYILSSPKKNKIRKFSKYFDFDKVFTVYDEHSDRTEFNCGSKKCIECMLCYSQNNVKYIHEKKK